MVVDPPTAVAVLAADARGQQIVSVSVKRTYRLLPDGRCQRADLPSPLLFRREPEGDDPGIPESDVIPFKASTDLIVMTSAFAAAGATSATVELRVGPLTLPFAVLGPRRCLYRGRGSYRFSKPEPFESVPLHYGFAYGGVDPTLEIPDQVPLEDVCKLYPGAYPRNPSGLGYVVRDNRERIDGLLLPQIENPADLLDADRLVTGDPRLWWRQPFPWGCDWFDGLWYPRQSFFGALPEGVPDDDAQLFEARAGWIQPGQKARFAARSAVDRLDTRFADAASPALVLPFMSGRETIHLGGVTPGGGDLDVQLPGEVPRVRVTLLARTEDVPVVPNRILVSTREMGVYLVWHAAYHPPRELPLRHPTRANPLVPDLEGVTVTADGVAVPTYEDWESADAKAS